ncbi:MAG: PepSY domain-containing protein [Aestuariivirga sp.]
MSSNTSAQQNAAASTRLYRAVWRWHFYAGLFVIPFLLMLAVTGAFMMIYSDVTNELGWGPNVEVTAKRLPVSTQAKAALAAVDGGKLLTYIAPRLPDKPAYFEVGTNSATYAVAIDPSNAKILASNDESTTWRNKAEKIHDSLFLGLFGRYLIEAAASLIIILVSTGIYMWWPREGGFLRLLVPNLAQKGRAFWRDLHASTGTWLSVFLVFFVLSGLAWTNVWGGMLVQPWSSFPASKWDNVPLSDQTHASLNNSPDYLREVPWGLEQTPLPASGSQVGTTAVAALVTLDGVVQWARANGFAGQFRVAIPGDEKSVFTVSIDGRNQDSPSPAGDRFVHIDQYTGNVLAEVRYGEYKLLGKAIAWGIGLHKGITGRINFGFNLVYLSLVIFLCISGVVMWWKRRPVGHLAAPLYPRDYRLTAGVGIIAAILGLAFPLGGLAILTFALIDFLLPKRLKEAGFQT